MNIFKCSLSLRYPPGYFTFTGQFDFFNYAGIQRSVKLYTTPKTYIDDITIVTNLIDNNTANLNYQLKIGGPTAGASYEVAIAGEHDSGIFIITNLFNYLFFVI